MELIEGFKGCMEKGLLGEENTRWHNFAEKKEDTTAQRQLRVHENIFIPARDLEITDGDNPSNWSWHTIPHGREAAKLIGDSELDITGEIDTRQLTKPYYGVYFVFKLEKNHKNIDKGYAAVGKTDKGHLISLAKKPQVRKDTWFEVLLGVYQTNPEGDNERLRMSLCGIDDYTNKYGLIVKGIGIRPRQRR